MGASSSAWTEPLAQGDVKPGAVSDSVRAGDAPHSDARRLGEHLAEGTWFALERTPPKGELWERGVSAGVLARRNRTPGSGKGRPLNTRKGIDTALRELSAYEGGAETPTREENASNGRRQGLHGRMTTESSTWRNPVTEPVRVDQRPPVTSRNVVGAYADVVRDDSMQIFVGPELSIDADLAGDAPTPHKKNEPSTLGVGMQFQWSF